MYKEKKFFYFFMSFIMTMTQMNNALAINLKISSPSRLEEGTQRKLSPQQIAEILPWATNAKSYLTQLLNLTSTYSMNEKQGKLLFGIRDIVLNHAPRNTELLMRYILNIRLVLHQIVDEHTQLSDVEIIDIKVKILEQSTRMAIIFCQHDLS